MSILNSKVLTISLSLVSVWILFSVISVEFERQETQKQQQAVEDKISKTENDNKLLGQYLDNLKNPEFLKKEARLRVNFKEPGEEVVFVHREVELPKASSAEEFYLKSWSKKWWNRLF